MKTMTYKGFTGLIRWNEEDQYYSGKLLNIDDLIRYEGSTLEELEIYFHEAVDEYIEDLKEESEKALTHKAV